MLSGAAKTHKRMFGRFVAEAGDPNVVVRQPAAPTAPISAAEKVLGRKSDTTQGEGYGESRTVKAVVSDAAVTLADVYASIPPQIAAIGRAEKLDLILRLPLGDALLIADAKYGQTIFDTAKDIQIGGAVFTVRATDRTGLPPEGPYILWVALRKAGE